MKGTTAAELLRAHLAEGTLEGIREAVQSGREELEMIRDGRTIRLLLEVSDRQRRILLAGSLLDAAG